MGFKMVAHRGLVRPAPGTQGVRGQAPGQGAETTTLLRSLLLLRRLLQQLLLLLLFMMKPPRRGAHAKNLGPTAGHNRNIVATHVFIEIQSPHTQPDILHPPWPSINGGTSNPPPA
jgi:hypothetical protein